MLIVPTLLSVFAVAPLLPSLSDDPIQVAKDLEAKLESGVDDSDLEVAQAALEWDFGNARLLEASARVAKELDEPDLAFWYACLASEAADSDGDKAAGDRLTEFLLEVSPGDVDALGMFESYAKDLFQVAKDCKTKKLFANAADVLLRCRGTRFERRAESMMDSFFKKDDAIDAIFKSGIDLPARPVTRKSAKWIAEYDSKNQDWDELKERDKAKNGFIVQTDMGYEMEQTFIQTMTQMGVFYKDFFNIRKKVKPMTIRVYGQRDEMAAQEGEFSESVAGWYHPGKRLVATFDPRSRNRSFAGLWETLFHEAAHVFTYAISNPVLPGWLSEGIACYFEGAKLLPSGAVITNTIPEGRLKNLVYLMGDGRPGSMIGAIRYYQPGSFGGEFYPYSWGLVYYLYNYENEDSERIYIPLFEKYFKAYTKEKTHDVEARFVEYFVTDAEVPGVTDIRSFEAHWKKWINELHELSFGDADEAAKKLIARADKQEKNKKPEYAIESLRWAVEKRPDDIALRVRYADALRKAKRDDPATFHYRQAIADARSFEGDKVPGLNKKPKAVVEACLEGISKISKNVGGKLGRADETLVNDIKGAADDFVAAGYKRSALYLVETASRVMGGHRELDSFALDLIEKEKVDIRRRRRLRVASDLEGWRADGNAEAGSGNSLTLDPGESMQTDVVYLETPVLPFRFEVKLTLDEEHDQINRFGLVLGEKPGAGSSYLWLSPNGRNGMVMRLAVITMENMGDDPFEIFGTLDKTPKLKEGDSLVLSIEADGEKLIVRANDEVVGEIEMSAEDLAGRVGLTTTGSKVTFSDFVLSF